MFQLTMNGVFRDLLDKCVIIYVDDILIYSKTREQHLKDLEAIFSAAAAASSHHQGLQVRVFKTRTGVPGARDLQGGDSNRPEKTPGYSGVETTNKSAAATIILGFRELRAAWGEKQQAAFEALKTLLMSPPVLRIADPERPFEVITDASDIAIGEVLMQDFGNGLQPIAYESRKMQSAERNYPVHDKEMLAIVHAFKIWRCYLTGADVMVRTDHKSLQYLRAQPNLNPWQIRWLDYLESNFTYNITYKNGANNIADALSRPSAQLAAVLVAQSNPLLSGLFTHRYSTDPFFDTWARYGTRLQFSSACHPQTDGQTERTNQTMEQLIRTNCPDQKKWEDVLPMLEFSYNNAPSATTNHSPFYLNYGMDPTA
ncbi:hypothetical protein CLOM_g20233 [Closterium sp. NIES-68]|nr:hypothetical protein CLOM_g20233 [Closterium sp. NIES-68]